MQRIKALLGMSCLVFAGAATQSIAAPINHNVIFGAVVQGSCSLSGTPSGTGAFSAVSQAASTFTVGVTGSTANPTTGELALGTITCNSASMKVTLTPDGWIRRASGPGEITYSAYVKNGTTDLNGGNPFVHSGGGTPPKTVNVSLSSIALNLLIQTNQATTLPAGNYSGLLAVSIDSL